MIYMNTDLENSLDHSHRGENSSIDRLKYSLHEYWSRENCWTIAIEAKIYPLIGLNIIYMNTDLEKLLDNSHKGENLPLNGL